MSPPQVQTGESTPAPVDKTPSTMRPPAPYPSPETPSVPTKKPKGRPRKSAPKASASANTNGPESSSAASGSKKPKKLPMTTENVESLRSCITACLTTKYQLESEEREQKYRHEIEMVRAESERLAAQNEYLKQQQALHAVELQRVQCQNQMLMNGMPMMSHIPQQMMTGFAPQWNQQMQATAGQPQYFAQQTSMNNGQHAPANAQNASMNAQNTMMNAPYTMNAQNAPINVQHTPTNSNTPNTAMNAPNTMNTQNATTNMMNAPNTMNHNAPSNAQNTMYAQSAPMNAQDASMNRSGMQCDQQPTMDHPPHMPNAPNMQWNHQPFVNQPQFQNPQPFHTSPQMPSTSFNNTLSYAPGGQQSTMLQSSSNVPPVHASTHVPEGSGSGNKRRRVEETDD